MRRLIDYLSVQLDLSKEQKYVIYYGLFVVTTNLLSIVSVLAIGYLMHQGKETLILLLCYLPLRLYLGGYHCQTPLRCYFFFNVLFYVVILIMIYLKHSYALDVITEIILFIVIFDKQRPSHKITNILLIGYVIAIPIVTLLLEQYGYLLVLSVDTNLLLYYLKYMKNAIS